MGKRIFEIQVHKCTGLKRFDDPGFNPRAMLPFFSFDFYTFEYRSPTANGASPLYNVIKRYEVDDNRDIQEYFKYQFLKIDFIDESVDIIANPDANDYIGSVRIPLQEYLDINEKVKRTYPVVNEKNKEAGLVEVTIALFIANSPEDIASNTNQGKFSKQEALQSEILIKEVVMHIVKKFADTGFGDLDAFMDMLFVSGKHV